MQVLVYAVRTIRGGDKKPSDGVVALGLGVAVGAEGTVGVEVDDRGGGGWETGFTGVGCQQRHLDVAFGFLVLNGEANQRAAATLQNAPWLHLHIIARFCFFIYCQCLLLFYLLSMPTGLVVQFFQQA